MIIDVHHPPFCCVDLLDKNGIRIKDVFRFNTETKESWVIVERTDGEIVSLDELKPLSVYTKIEKRILLDAELVRRDKTLAVMYGVEYRKTYI